MNKIKEQSASADFSENKKLSARAFTGRNMNNIRGREDLANLGEKMGNQRVRVHWRKRSSGRRTVFLDLDFVIVAQQHWQAGYDVTCHFSLLTI